MSCGDRLERLLTTVLPLLDVLEGRVETAAAPAWCERRGWTSFLLGLDDSALRQAESHGLAATLPALANVPGDLLALARDVELLTRLPALQRAQPLPGQPLRSVKLRKRAQLAGLLAGVASMAESAERIVDVGAGNGHFTRLSAELFGRPALGLERSAERVAVARRRARESNVSAQFVAVDARDTLQLGERDLAVGLHACGELGDRLVESAARAGCDLALISCCLQKISTPTRRPLSRLAQQAELRREHLGLTNLTAQPQGVEAGIEATIAARQTRFALARLLKERGVRLEPGAEMSGINRRRAQHGLGEVATRALRLRGLAPPNDAELAHHELAATRDYASIRRLSLPRSMLARLIEVLVCLDRGAYLEQHGHHVLVATLFERAASPRNIGIFSSRRLERLQKAG